MQKLRLREANLPTLVSRFMLRQPLTLAPVVSITQQSAVHLSMEVGQGNAAGVGAALLVGSSVKGVISSFLV